MVKHFKRLGLPYLLIYKLSAVKMASGFHVKALEMSQKCPFGTTSLNKKKQGATNCRSQLNLSFELPPELSGIIGWKFR